MDDWDGGLADGEGLGSGGEEVGDGLGTSEPVPRGSFGLSAGGHEDSVSEGGGCNAVVQGRAFGLGRCCVFGWVVGGMREAPGRLNLLGVG